MSAWCVFPGEGKAGLSLGGEVEPALRQGLKALLPCSHRPGAPKEPFSPPSPRPLCLKLLHPNYGYSAVNNVSSTYFPPPRLLGQGLGISVSQVPGTLCPVLAGLRKEWLALCQRVNAFQILRLRVFVCLSCFTTFSLIQEWPIWEDNESATGRPSLSATGTSMSKFTAV